MRNENLEKEVLILLFKEKLPILGAYLRKKKKKENTKC